MQDIFSASDNRIRVCSISDKRGERSIWANDATVWNYWFCRQGRPMHWRSVTEASYARPSFSAKTSKKLAGIFFFAEETGRVYTFRRGNCRGSRRAKKRACLLFPQREWGNLARRDPRQPNKELDEQNDVFRPSSFSVVCTRLESNLEATITELPSWKR